MGSRHVVIVISGALLVVAVVFLGIGLHGPLGWVYASIVVALFAFGFMMLAIRQQRNSAAEPAPPLHPLGGSRPSLSGATASDGGEVVLVPPVAATSQDAPAVTTPAEATPAATAETSTADVPRVPATRKSAAKKATATRPAAKTATASKVAAAKKAAAAPPAAAAEDGAPATPAKKTAARTSAAAKKAASPAEPAEQTTPRASTARKSAAKKTTVADAEKPVQLSMTEGEEPAEPTDPAAG
jgi:type IV secretory pathway VirB10-like protein